MNIHLDKNGGEVLQNKGIFVISLDLELNWGVHDCFSLTQYKNHLLGAREIVSMLLQRFKQYQIHATWATVGFLFFTNKQELVEEIPDIKPNYDDRKLSSYDHLENVGENEKEDPYHFGESLVKRIIANENQEIATHTFSHYYCLAAGQNAKAFELDITQAIKVAKGKNNIPIKSIVFPRNQIEQSYLYICENNGLTAYRGYENHWLYKVTPHQDGKLKRMIRLLDSYINLSGHHLYTLDEVYERFSIVNIPSSRFLRPYSKTISMLEPLKRRRIKTAMTKAAKEGKVFHLWWHPHNFGINQKENFHMLDDILGHYQRLKKQYGMESMTMKEVSEKVNHLPEEE